MVNEGDIIIALFLCPGNKWVSISRNSRRAPGRVVKTWLYNII